MALSVTTDITEINAVDGEQVTVTATASDPTSTISWEQDTGAGYTEISTGNPLVKTMALGDGGSLIRAVAVAGSGQEYSLTDLNPWDVWLTINGGGVLDYVTADSISVTANSGSNDQKGYKSQPIPTGNIITFDATHQFENPVAGASTGSVGIRGALTAGGDTGYIAYLGCRYDLNRIELVMNGSAAYTVSGWDKEKPTRFVVTGDPKDTLHVSILQDGVEIYSNDFAMTLNHDEIYLVAYAGRYGTRTIVTNASLSVDVETAYSTPIPVSVSVPPVTEFDAIAKITYDVNVYVGGTDTDSNIGLEPGLCSWSTDDMSLGVLADNWITGISDKVDITVAGNYTQYSSPTLKLVRSKNIETILSAYGLKLTGSRIEIIEHCGTSSIVLFRGVVLNPRIVGNELSLPLSHVANYYNSQLAPRIGDNYSPLVFGRPDNVELQYVAPDDYEGDTIGDGLLPVWEVVLVGQDVIELVSVYDQTVLSLAEIIDYYQSGYHFKMSGSESLVGTTSITIVSPPDPVEMRFFPIPMNKKDGDGNNIFNVGDKITLIRTEYGKIYLPYGSDTQDAIDSLQYENNGQFFPFPSYIDSRVDYDDRIEILDADDIGTSYLKPISYGLDNGSANLTINYRENGFWTNLTPSIGTSVENFSRYNDRGDDFFEFPTIDFSLAGTSGDVYFAFVTKQTFKFDKDSIPDSIFPTGYIQYRKFTATSNLDTYEVRLDYKIVTVSGTYVISDGWFNMPNISGTTTGLIQDNRFPLYPANDDTNTRYRWLDLRGIAEYIDLFSEPIEDYEKVAGFTVYCIATFRANNNSGGAWDISGDIRIKQYFTTSSSYDTGKLYSSGSKGRNDINGTEITTTDEAYKSVLQLQNYSTYGITTPLSGWGLEYPSESLDGVIDSTISPISYSLKWQPENVDAKNLKIQLLKYTSGIGYINNSGLEDWESVLSMYNSGGYLLTAYDIAEDTYPDTKDIDPTRVYTDIGVTYANGNITITNTEQETYSSDYVTGVTDPELRKRLWKAGHLLYVNYGIKNSYPEKLGDINGIESEANAISYIEKQYGIAGITFSDDIVTLRKRYTAKIVISRKTAWDIIDSDGKLEIGQNLTFSFPNIATADTCSVVEVSTDVKTGRTTLTLQCVGDTIDSSENLTIVETATQPDIIEESGTGTTIYKEDI